MNGMTPGHWTLKKGKIEINVIHVNKNIKSIYVYSKMFDHTISNVFKNVCPCIKQQST